MLSSLWFVFPITASFSFLFWAQEELDDTWLASGPAVTLSTVVSTLRLWTSLLRGLLFLHLNSNWSGVFLNNKNMWENTQKSTYCKILIIEMSRVGKKKKREREKQKAHQGLPRAGGVGSEYPWCRILGRWNILPIDSGDASTASWMYSCSRMAHFTI